MLRISFQPTLSNQAYAECRSGKSIHYIEEAMRLYIHRKMGGCGKDSG